jgi:PAS domain S-box-containing protein
MNPNHHYSKEFTDSSSINNSNPFQLHRNQPTPQQIPSFQPNTDPPFFNLNDSVEKDGECKANLSRHVSSVISHFTSSKDGYSRLLNELDDFIHSISMDMSFIYTSPSVFKYLGYTQDEMMEKSIHEVIHQSDWGFYHTFIETSINSHSEFMTHCRYITKSGNIKLLEIKGKPFVDPDPNTSSPVQLILSGREYTTKSSQALDSIVDLQIERLALRTKLEKALRRAGRDPLKNIYFMDSPDGEEFADTYLQVPTREPDYSLSDLFPTSPSISRGNNGSGEIDKKKVR